MSTGTVIEPEVDYCQSGHYYLRVAPGVWCCENCPKLHISA